MERIQLEDLSHDELRCRLHLLESDLRILPCDPWTHAERCLLFSAAGDHRSADRAFKVGAKLCPDSSLIFLVGATVALENDDWEIAHSRVTRVIELDPGDRDARRLLDAIHVRRGVLLENAAARRAGTKNVRRRRSSELDARLWSEHPILRILLVANAWMDRRDRLSKLALKGVCFLPLVGLLTALEASVANFPLPEAFVLALMPALFFGEISVRIGEAMLVVVPRLRAKMPYQNVASGAWTLALALVFFCLVVIQSRGHGGGPLLWVPFFTICAFGVLRKVDRSLDTRFIHSFGAMSALCALYAALITPN